MSESQEKESARRRNPLREVLESLVVPALEDEAVEPMDDFQPVEILEDDDGITVRGILGHGTFIHVTPHAIDGERTLLRIGMLAGYILGASIEAPRGQDSPGCPVHDHPDRVGSKKYRNSA